ncbi:NAD-dependent epimerase/dehydratase family protein [Mucilaginibacter sp. HMF5004]|nr:NAD-dependent epimerase/dehydratase family protein [Mucilaginibacter rivuli]
MLVTGATGFLGAEVVKQLAATGDNITCTKRELSKIPQQLLAIQNIRWLDADVLDIPALDDAFDGITHVYHCAAIVSFNPARKAEMVKTNVEGTANIVNLCLKNGVRLVHVSSIAAIGMAKPGQLTTENNHLEETPHEDGYAISKYESEMEVWRGIAEGLDAVIVNPSLIIGAAAGTEGTGKIFAGVRKGMKYYTGGSCGFVDVEDVAKSMIALMDTDITGKRYIINAENWTWKNLLTEAAENFDLKPPQREAKPWMLGLAWRVSVVLGAISGFRGLDKVSAQAASKSMNYCNKKIKKAIGIEFKPVSKSIGEICAILRIS